MSKKRDEAQEQAEDDQAERDLVAALRCDARLDIRRAAELTEEGKLAIAEWLREQAEKLLYDGSNYSTLYTAMYNPED